MTLQYCRIADVNLGSVCLSVKSILSDLFDIIMVPRGELVISWRFVQSTNTSTFRVHDREFMIPIREVGPFYRVLESFQGPFFFNEQMFEKIRPEATD